MNPNDKRIKPHCIALTYLSPLLQTSVHLIHSVVRLTHKWHPMPTDNEKQSHYVSIYFQQRKLTTLLNWNHNICRPVLSAVHQNHHKQCRNDEVMVAFLGVLFSHQRFDMVDNKNGIEHAKTCLNNHHYQSLDGTDPIWSKLQKRKTVEQNLYAPVLWKLSCCMRTQQHESLKWRECQCCILSQYILQTREMQFNKHSHFYPHNSKITILHICSLPSRLMLRNVFIFQWA